VAWGANGQLSGIWLGLLASASGGCRAKRLYVDSRFLCVSSGGDGLGLRLRSARSAAARCSSPTRAFKAYSAHSIVIIIATTIIIIIIIIIIITVIIIIITIW